MRSQPIASSTRRAFVVGPYLSYGGAHMAYHLGRMLHLDYGFDIVAVTVGDESGDNGIFRYDGKFPRISASDMQRQIDDPDILIANPSFSNYLFGPRLPGSKLIYIKQLNKSALL